MARLLNMAPDLTVEPDLDAHLLYLRRRNQMPRSIRERRFTVLRAARALGHPLAVASRDELRCWQESIDHLEPGSQHNAIVHVAQYLKWAATHDVRDDDPSVVLVRPRNLSNALPRPMADSDIRRALDTAPDEDVHAWIGLGAFCGLRCMEMAKVARDEIITGVTNPYLRIVGKGGGERVVNIPSHLLAELQGSFRPRSHLFARMDGKPGPPSAMRVSERINDHLHAIGIPDTAHALRHRFGTKLYEETLDLALVAEVMGHKSIDTTRMYVRIVAGRAAGPIEAISHLAA